MAKNETRDGVRFLQEYRATGNIMRSMIVAGWSEATARGGMKKLPQELQEQIRIIDAGGKPDYKPAKQPKAHELIERGRETTKEELQLLAMGRLGHELESGDNIQAVKVAFDVAPPESEPISEATAARITRLAEILLIPQNGKNLKTDSFPEDRHNPEPRHEHEWEDVQGPDGSTMRCKTCPATE